MSPRRGFWQSPSLPASPLRNQGHDDHRPGLASDGSWSRAPSVEFDFSSLMGQLVRSDTITEGLARRLATSCAPGAPFREENNQRPRLGPVTFTHRSDSRPRRASRPFLDRAPRCLESTSTTNITSRALASSHISGGSLPGAVGKPASVQLRDRPLCPMSPSRPRAAPDPLARIQPPATPRLTAWRRLRVGRSSLLAASTLVERQSSRVRASCSGASPALSAA